VHISGTSDGRDGPTACKLVAGTVHRFGHPKQSTTTGRVCFRLGTRGWNGRYVWLGPDGQSRSFDVMPTSRPDGLGEIANLGLTLAEAKLLPAQVQQVVAAQAHHHAMFRPDCQSCDERYHAKGWRHRATYSPSAPWPGCSVREAKIRNRAGG